MTSMTLKKMFSKNLKLFLNFFTFSLFCYFVPSLINERSHTVLLAFEEGAAKHILRVKIWLYVFDIVISQDPIDFSFVVSNCCSFCNRMKNLLKTGLNAFLYRHRL